VAVKATKESKYVTTPPPPPPRRSLFAKYRNLATRQSFFPQISFSFTWQPESFACRQLNYGSTLF